jgi:hypothetical protein
MSAVPSRGFDGPFVFLFWVQLLILQAFYLGFRRKGPDFREYSGQAQLKKVMEHILTVA